jgi:hypothetical protein
MARNPLRIVIVLGVLITLLGGTGIFAVFSDRATTGSNDVTSSALGRAADLLIAVDPTPHDPQSSPPFDCGTFSDDLATGLFSFTTNMSNGNGANVCLRNAGTADADLTMTAIDLTDLDVDCTGDEAAFGDTTCGNNDVGELSPFLFVNATVYECSGGGSLSGLGGSASLSALASSTISLGSLPVGQDRCVVLQVIGSASGADAQIAQSDQSTWRFAFDGTVPSN